MRKLFPGQVRSFGFKPLIGSTSGLLDPGLGARGWVQVLPVRHVDVGLDAEQAGEQLLAHLTGELILNLVLKFYFHQGKYLNKFLDKVSLTI